jgi:hypothetical protein
VDAVSSFGPVGTVLANPLQNVVNVLNLPTTQSFVVPLDVAGLIAPLIEAPAAAGLAAQGVIDAIKTGDAASVLGAIADAPAVVAGGVLQGGIGPNIGPLVAPLLGLPPEALGPLVFGGLLSPNIGSGANGLIAAGTISGLQGLASLVADALKPPAIPKTQATTFALTKADPVSATPTALPSLKSALVGIKTPHALTAKPAKTTATPAADTKTADSTAAADAKPAASDAGSDTGNQPTKTRAKHRASTGDTAGKHTRSHDSSDAGKGGKGGSGGGRHHAA